VRQLLLLLLVLLLLLLVQLLLLLVQQRRWRSNCCWLRAGARCCGGGRQRGCAVIASPAVLMPCSHRLKRHAACCRGCCGCGCVRGGVQLQGCV
jgi:hypothetical protein